MNKSTIYFTLSMLFIILCVIIISPTGEIKKGNCYDEKDNKINGLVCDVPVTVGDNLKYGALIGTFCILGFMFFLGKAIIELTK